jgi:type I restriction enzyme M protein
MASKWQTLTLSAHWREQRAAAVKLDAAIEANLKGLGYGG